MKINAIRSLSCRDHAENIPPTVLEILWLLGKRCNYDCSYCSPHTHDAVSPFVDPGAAFKTIDTMCQIAATQNKTIKWSFSGGEPFIDPTFSEILKKISASDIKEEVHVVTNGSLPAATYLELLPFLSGITFSIHLERSHQEIVGTISTIKQVHAAGEVFVTVNLMMLPGKTQQTLWIKDQFTSAGVACNVRRITPLPAISESDLPFEYTTSNKKKSVRMYDISTQTQNKRTWRQRFDSVSEHTLRGFYSLDEYELLENMASEKTWQNLGAWTDRGYHELNSNELVAKKLNQFKDWVCYIGVDCLWIDFDGYVYRGQCQNAGSIGHINDEHLHLPFEPTICERNWCTCAADITTRKSRLNFTHLISSNQQSL